MEKKEPILDWTYKVPKIIKRATLFFRIAPKEPKKRLNTEGVVPSLESEETQALDLKQD